MSAQAIPVADAQKPQRILSLDALRTIPHNSAGKQKTN
jgi:hypothetical protein